MISHQTPPDQRTLTKPAMSLRSRVLSYLTPPFTRQLSRPVVWCSAIIFLVFCLLLMIFLGIVTLIVSLLVIKPRYPSFDIPNSSLNPIYFDLPDDETSKTKGCTSTSSKRTDQDQEITNKNSNIIISRSFSSVLREDHNINVDKGKVKRIGAYTSAHRILLVGEGDFSFSACLARTFGSHALNLVATSLNSQGFLNKHYGKFPVNKKEVQGRGSLVLHGVDATKMANHPLLGTMKFNRIIFNFPHSGFKQDSPSTEIGRHQKLVSGFLRNAKKMLDEEDGEIHITHKSTLKFQKWNIPMLGSDQGLNLIQKVKFKKGKYPGYHTKYGFGGDKDFDCNPSQTYMFAFF